MSDLIERKAAIDAVYKCDDIFAGDMPVMVVKADAYEALAQLPSAQPEIIRCHQCGFWDRDTLRHNFNDFREWNEAECLILAERDAYNEINRYTEADEYCSRAERRTDG